MSGCNSESLSSIDISPHSCLRWACPAAHERENEGREQRVGGREKREEEREIEKKKLTPTPKLKITHI